VAVIAEALTQISPSDPLPLAGRRALVTSGPTHEALDPVRYIANRSSGRQGHAIAAALARFGADTLLVSGPTALADPPGVAMRFVTTAREMLAETEAALPVDVAVFVAAVGDWRSADEADAKIKKSDATPTLQLIENPDILATVSQVADRRPALVVGFAAETEAFTENAEAKRLRKGCDWILANSVAQGATFGAMDNTVTLIGDGPHDSWPAMTKDQIADRLALRIGDHLRGIS
jgi:phosphopantothenoylcysteine decarboxylase/phosphopantothenate--cysteine ligase